MQPIRHVAILIESSRQYGRSLLRGVCQYHKEHASWLVYFRQQDLGASLPAWLSKWKGDGILARVTNLSTAKLLIKTGLPLIDLRGGTRKLSIPTFGPDNRAIAHMAFEHLFACGLRSFAFVGEPSGQHVYDDERRNRFCEIVKERGFECHVFDHKLNSRSDKDWEMFQLQMADWLRSLPKPIGVMCCHDDLGQQVLDACRRVDLGVPDEVAVVGADNDEFLCNLSIPSLSSVDLNTERIGYEAAQYLELLMSGKATFNEPFYFQPLCVVARQSTDVVACDDQDVASAVRLIRQHACNHLTVHDIEYQVGVSRTQLGRRFKQIIGRTMKHEMLRVQIVAAKQMLVDSDLPIYSIAQKCGFNEPKYFIVVFRKITGMTPRSYRLNSGRV